jgi:hypothetical protein
VLSLLLEFLSQVVALCPHNGNDTSSLNTLAQVFAPVLCRPPGSAYMSLRHIQVSSSGGSGARAVCAAWACHVDRMA